MFSNKTLQFLLIILILRIIRVRTLTVAELTNQHSKNVILKTKAEQILSFMNETVDPCEDFYEFACGNVGTLNLTNTVITFLNAVEDAVNQEIRLEMESDNGKDLVTHKPITSFYNSCINGGTMKGAADKDKLKEVLKEFGNMPVLEGEKWQENEFDWSQTIANIAFKTGQYSIFNIRPVGDLLNTSITRVQFGPPGFTLSRQSYVEESLSEHRKSRAARMANWLQLYLGVEETLAKATAKEMLDFESSLARGTIDNMLQNTPTELYVLDSTDSIQEKYLPIWNTKQFFQDAIGFVPIEALAEHQYLEHAKQVLEETPKRIIANYVYYMLLDKFTNHIIEPAKYRAYICMLNLYSNFYKDLITFIYRKHYDEQTKETIDVMWQELKSAGLNVLESTRLNWIPKETRKHVIEKMHAMMLRMPYFEDDNDADDFARLQLKSDDYLYNLKSIMHLKAQRTRTEFHRPPEEEMLKISQLSYNFEFNYVGVPLHVLQPFYILSSSYPYTYNFASLGSYVAHEIVHGFDDNIHDWWDSQSEKEFLTKKQCFVNQYKSYALPEMQVQYENLADNGGVRLAFDAFQTRSKRATANVTSESFPGLDYTAEQLFFLSYAHTWCANTHPDYLMEKASPDNHVPEKFRVIGPLSNFNEFSKAFNCPKGSMMNPISKCEIY